MLCNVVGLFSLRAHLFLRRKADGRYFQSEVDLPVMSMTCVSLSTVACLSASVTATGPGSKVWPRVGSADEDRGRVGDGTVYNGIWCKKAHTNTGTVRNSAMICAQTIVGVARARVSRVQNSPQIKYLARRNNLQRIVEMKRDLGAKSSNHVSLKAIENLPKALGA